MTVGQETWRPTRRGGTALVAGWAVVLTVPMFGVVPAHAETPSPGVAYSDLVVAKTAKTSFRRAYEWAVDKRADHSWAEVAAGERATFNYTVDVSPSGAIDTNFVVSGSIKISNRNDVDVTGVSIVDELNGASCSIEGGASGRTVPANGHLNVGYTCADPAGAATASGINSVAVRWDAAFYPGSSGESLDAAAYDYAAARVTVAGESATVTDTHLDLDHTAPDGVVLNAADGAKSFRYALSFGSPAGACQTYPNVVKVTPSGRRTMPNSDPVSDDASVTVCSEQAPSIAMTGQGDLERAYAWQLDKDVDATRRVIDPTTGTATFTYTVTVRAGAETVRGHQAGGR